MPNRIGDWKDHRAVRPPRRRDGDRVAEAAAAAALESRAGDGAGWGGGRAGLPPQLESSRGQRCCVVKDSILLFICAWPGPEAQNTPVWAPRGVPPCWYSGVEPVRSTLQVPAARTTARAPLHSLCRCRARAPGAPVAAAVLGVEAAIDAAACSCALFSALPALRAAQRRAAIPIYTFAGARNNQCTGTARPIHASMQARPRLGSGCWLALRSGSAGCQHAAWMQRFLKPFADGCTGQPWHSARQRQLQPGELAIPVALNEATQRVRRWHVKLGLPAGHSSLHFGRRTPLQVNSQSQGCFVRPCRAFLRASPPTRPAGLLLVGQLSCSTAAKATAGRRSAGRGQRSPPHRRRASALSSEVGMAAGPRKGAVY
jgi:hypothetical protein